MNLLVLGDVMGESGRNILKNKLPEIIIKNKIDFVVVNGENAADDGRGITKLIAEEFFSKGVDVITSGNHIWDKQETTDFIEKENRLLRPANLAEGSPGKGYEIFISKDKKYKIGVINLMGNVFMRKTEDVFQSAKNICKKLVLKKDVDFLIVDFHGEITSEKNAIGHFFDGKATLVVGTHTHIPTNDARVLKNGTAYQTDAGMCGDYDSIIGMDEDVPLRSFLSKRRVGKMVPAKKEATFCGSIIDIGDMGLAKNIDIVKIGGILTQT